MATGRPTELKIRCSRGSIPWAAKAVFGGEPEVANSMLQAVTLLTEAVRMAEGAVLKTVDE